MLQGTTNDGEFAESSEFYNYNLYEHETDIGTNSYKYTNSY